MYHEVTYREQRQRVVRRLLSVIIVVALAIAVWFVVSYAQASAREQAAASLRESVLSAAKQCCAVEGSYPVSLEHLENDYGLTINHQDYVVSYEWFADNVLPSVVVTAR